MVKVHRTRYSVEQYLDWDETSQERFEYFDGVVYAMAGGSALHAALALELCNELNTQLRSGRCRAYPADLRIEVDESGLFTYPDATVFCGPPELRPGRGPQTYRKPTIIFEVLSPSTEEYDRDEKFEHYARIPTLREYVLVSQDARRVEVRVRDGERWTTHVYGDGEVALLPSVNAKLDVRALYERATPPA